MPKKRDENILTIPINKGNYSMETPEREVLFEQYRGEAWPVGYLDYRRNWSEYAQQRFVAEYPLLVDIELATVCNLHCPMCYTITEEFKHTVKAEFMDIVLYKKIIDEICDKVPAIRLSLRGEPTLHPQFIEYIRYAKAKGIGEVSFLTNGSKLDADFFVAIMDAGADWITISIDGLDAVYESIRKPLKFPEMLHKIKDIKSIKDMRNAHRPVIKVQSIWPAIRDNPGLFYNTFAPFVDFIAFNPLIDYLSRDEEILYEFGFSCPQLYQRLVVGADGQVLLCSNDENGAEIVGNAKNQSVFSIWHGEKLNRIRRLHGNHDGFMDVPLCRKCYLPRLTEDNETSCVNGREFIIKNYVNRQQEIGT